MTKSVKTPSLPKEFLSRMEEFLGDEYEAFLDSYNHPISLGIRVNTLKISPDELHALIPASLKKIPWCPSGFQIHPTFEKNISLKISSSL